VRGLGYLNAPQLRAAYDSATVVVQSSLVETGGQVPPEAMQTGRPCWFRIAMARETCGGAAEYFDPTRRRTARNMPFAAGGRFPQAMLVEDGGRYSGSDCPKEVLPGWRTLSRRPGNVERAAGRHMFSGKVLLITGGTGTFGNAVLRRFLSTEIKEIRVFSRDEKKQEDQRLQYNNSKLKFYIGDVRAPTACALHARRGLRVPRAALKQVPSCEFYPMEALRTNTLERRMCSRRLPAAGSTGS